MSKETARRRYRGFISYSQKDKAWARRLHQALESYVVPKGVESSALKNGRRIGRFFRDDEELAGAQSLGAALEGAIDDSDTLIVICSPHAAQSKWVNEEVLRFKTRQNARVFGVIVGGEPNAADPKRECFPPALRWAVGPDGQLTDRPDEPLAPDVRKESFERIRARVAAGVLGVPFDDLWRRERRRRAARTTLTATASALALAAVVGLVVYFQDQVDAARPEEQLARFYDYMVAEYSTPLGDGEEDPFASTEESIREGLRVIAADDLNRDGMIDYIAILEDLGYCGSAGCLTAVYIQTADGFREVAGNSGLGAIVIRDEEINGYKTFSAQIGVTTTATPVYGRYAWTGDDYAIDRYEYCGNVMATFCDPTLFTPIYLQPESEIDRLQALTEGPGEDFIEPETIPGETPPRYEDGVAYGDLVAVSEDGAWLMIDIWKSTFVFRRISPSAP